MDLLKQSEETLEVLEVRAIPGEVELSLQLSRLKSLTLDQGIHLSKLCKFNFFLKFNFEIIIITPSVNNLIIFFSADIKCPKLSALRVQVGVNSEYMYYM